MISSCATRTIYITPKIDNIEIPATPKLHTDVPAIYDKKLDKIMYSVSDAAKLNANILILRKDNEALRKRLEGIKKALEKFKESEKK